MEKSRSRRSRLDPPERIVVQYFHVWTLYPKIYLARLVELCRLTQLARNLEPRDNVTPTTTIDAVRVRDGATRAYALGSRAELVEENAQGRSGHF